MAHAWLELWSELVALFVWKGALTVILIIESCSSIWCFLVIICFVRPRRLI
jgi:hypothetical protein